MKTLKIKAFYSKARHRCAIGKAFPISTLRTKECKTAALTPLQGKPTTWKKACNFLKSIIFAIFTLVNYKLTKIQTAPLLFLGKGAAAIYFTGHCRPVLSIIVFPLSRI